MSKKYKHLNEKEKRKSIFYSKLKEFIKKSLKWSFVVVSIVLLFTVGLVAFYISLDRSSNNRVKESFLTMNNLRKNSDMLDDTQNLNELEKKELERESEKDKIISDSIPIKQEEDKGNDKDKKNSTSLETQENNSTDENKFYNFSEWNYNNSLETIVVNAGNPLNKNFKPKTKICRGKEVHELACDDLENMISDAKKDGVILWISSGYRSVDLQKRLFNRQIEREKSKAIISQEEAERRASRVVARPYTSEHNTGLAIDFNGVEDNFYKTKEYKWLMENAHKYGFIERYQERHKQCTGVIYEPWHFRYVGKELAPLIKESGLCLEEYIEKNFVS